MASGEFIVGDGTYNDETCIYSDQGELLKPIRTKQETVFSRCKSFNIPQHRFRHRLEKNCVIFYAVANLTQCVIQTGEKLFEVHGLD